MYERKVEKHNREVVHQIYNDISREESEKDQEEFNKRMEKYNYNDINITIPF